jgi:hypothetical protein
MKDKNNKSTAGKGDRRRPFRYKEWAENYDSILWENKNKITFEEAKIINKITSQIISEN